MNHFLSIVVPVFNRTWQLRRALSSLVNQTYKNFEVVICDDGSTENVATVIDEFCSKLSIVFVRIDNSGGPARPRNVASAKTRGEWICFLDSDDWWDVQRLAVIVAELNNDIDLLYHPLRLISSDFRKVRRGLK